jgi:hypothetical protein
MSNIPSESNKANQFSVRDGHQRGWSFTPLNGKRPTAKGWQAAPRETAEQAEAWAAAGNIGLRTGSASGVVVVDVDGADTVPAELPPSPTVRTARGFHVYFAAPNPAPGNRAGLVIGGCKVDIRGEGGQVVYPGSVHPTTGVVYEWVPGRTPHDLPLAEFPLGPDGGTAVVEPQTPKPSGGGGYGRAALEQEVGRVATAAEGQRNHQLNASAFALGQLVAGGVLDRAEVEGALSRAATAAGLEPAEIAATLASGLGDGMSQPRGVPEVRTVPEVPAEPEVVAPAKPEPFPTWALPASLQAYVEEAAAAMRCDGSYVSLPLLACTAGVIGSTWRLRVKNAWTEPAIIWAAVIGESGSVKSPAVEAAGKPLRALQSDLRRQFRFARQQYERDLAAWAAGESQGDKPTEPIEPRLYTGDATVEALGRLLSENPRGTVVVRDELSGWFGSFDKYTNTSGGDEGQWCEAFGGREWVIDRKKDGRLFIASASVSICGAIPVKVFRRVMGEHRFDSGLAARLLLSMPAKEPKTWTEDDVSEPTTRRVVEVYRRLGALVHAENEWGEPTANMAMLSAAAREVWVDYYNRHNREGAGMTDKRAAAWAKFEAYPLRLALLFHLVAWAEGTSDRPPAEVEAESLLRAIDVIEWCKAETLRIYTAMDRTAMDGLMDSLVDYIRSQGGRATVREICRGPREFRGRQGEVEVALHRLCNIGRLVRRELEADGGGAPSAIYFLAGNGQGAGATTP